MTLNHLLKSSSPGHHAHPAENGRTGSRYGSGGLLLLWLLLLAVGQGCSSRPSWNLVLSAGETKVELPLEIMNVYLSEYEEEPELYEIKGDGVSLVGQFPLDVRVGYEEDWSQLLSNPIGVSRSGSVNLRPLQSFVSLPDGSAVTVTSGSIVFDEISGKYAGIDGDLTLSGRITLQLESGSAPVTWDGTIAVQTVSWG